MGGSVSNTVCATEIKPPEPGNLHSKDHRVHALHVWRNPGARPINDFSIEFEIRPKF